jgi:hypothetical protein
MIQKIRQYLFYPRFHFNRFQFNLVAVFFLTVGFIAGSYLTLSKIFPSVFALNDTTKTWTFSTANASQFTYDASLVTVDDTGAHPVTGVNKITNPAFATNNTGWSIAALAGSTTPTGYTLVPGNSNFVATGSAFLAMKYEAKCANSGTPTVGLTSPADTTYEVYKDDGTVTPANNCTAANSRVVTSLASGYPVAYISQTEAATRCSTVTIGGSAAHLITNDEWMTIANDAEQQAANWTGAAVGSGYLFSGHNDNTPAKARVASTTDTGNYRCAYTDASPGTEAPSACPTKIALGESGLVGNQVRVLTLSNGAPIWDFAGNGWEWTNNTVPANLQPTSWNGTTDATTGDWSDYASGSLPRYLHSYVSGSPVTQLKSEPTSSSYTHNAKYGIGRIWNYSLSGSATAYGFLRGGNWGDAVGAGAFALTLYYTPDYRGSGVGFRCASDPVALSQSWSSSSGRGAAGGNSVVTSAVTDTELYQSVNVESMSTYDFSAYVYNTTSGSVGGTVDATVASLYYGGNTITNPLYTAVAGETGWYKLTGTVTGVASTVNTGLLVKSGKTITVDDVTLSKQGTYSVYTTTAYTNAQVSTWDSFTPTVSGATGNASVGYQICLDNGSACSYSTGSRWQYYTAGAWANATDATTTYANTAAQLTQAAMQALPTTSQKISVKAIMSFGGSNAPSVSSIAVGLTTDTTAPDTNASALAMTRSNGGTTVASGSWTNNSAPYFSWTAGADNVGGVGLKGYCLYLGTDTAGNPATAKGLLGTSPVDTTGTTCQFIISGTSIDFATASYRGSPWLTTSSSPYYLNIKAIDNAGNVFSGSSAQFAFKYDNTVPTNVVYISPASGNFSNVVDMNFAWPASGGNAASDANAGLLGWQYQINSSAGTWQGTTHNTDFNLDYIPATASAYTLVTPRDGTPPIVSGNNVIYFRTVDAAGNLSSDTTIRTGNLSYGGAAPAFGGSDNITVTPTTSTDNSYALSWPAATATNGQTIAHYYYMINTSPPSTLATLQGNSSTYIDNGTSLTVSAAALPGVNKGTNTIYVVAIDNASTPNYSPSNYISGTFTLNSTDPDNVGNLVASDSSIKSQSQWNVTLTWTAPTYQGAGNLTYIVKRSTDNVTFTQVGTSSGLSYVDSAPSSTLYYYKVYTKDGASAVSSGTNAVSITPTGKWTSAPTLSSGPDAGSISVKKATITWSTSRTADSKVQYGTTSGSYNTVEPSSSSQVTSHSIQITGLTPGTTYYYKAKWTDEDGNTGTSGEKSFSTSAAPSVQDVTASSIGLTSALLTFTSNGASSVKIYYGTTTSFGGAVTMSTSTSSTKYTSQLTGLLDGTKYYYKINTFDSDGTEYDGTVLDFTTLPRPKISNVLIQQVANTAQSTILVSWTTNTEISSIVTYYPAGNAAAARDNVNVALTKGNHQMIVSGLLPQTDYYLVVKGRDKIGNEATSDSQKLTTATDTRPPTISELHVEGSNVPPVGSTAQEQSAQLIVSWNTDEPGTSQVEFGEGTGDSYSQKTQQDENLTTNHLVIISGLTPSKVYHLRALSLDAAKNVGQSIDTVTITPKATENALNLVITNLQQVFGFLRGIGK